MLFDGITSSHDSSPDRVLSKNARDAAHRIINACEYDKGEVTERDAALVAWFLVDFIFK